VATEAQEIEHYIKTGATKPVQFVNNILIEKMCLEDQLVEAKANIGKCGVLVKRNGFMI
jgi:hypothetical protein